MTSRVERSRAILAHLKGEAPPLLVEIPKREPRRPQPIYVVPDEVRVVPTEGHKLDLVELRRLMRVSGVRALSAAARALEAAEVGDRPSVEAMELEARAAREEVGRVHSAITDRLHFVALADDEVRATLGAASALGRALVILHSGVHESADATAAALHARGRR